MVYCKCGCGQIVKEGRFFVHGHNSKLNPLFISFKKGHIPWINGGNHTKKSKKKMSKSHKGKHYSSKTEFKKGHIPVNKFEKGHIPWNKNKKGVMPIPWNKNKKGCFSEVTLEKQSKHHKGKHYSPKTEFKKGYKQPKDIEEKRIKNVLKGLFKRPTSFEKLFKSYGMEDYKYVGDGSFLIGYKNPDFININGKKIVVEVFANYFKIRDYGSIEDYIKQRSNYFKKYGWVTIFFDENEITNKEFVISKIKEVEEKWLKSC